MDKGCHSSLSTWPGKCWGHQTCPQGFSVLCDPRASPRPAPPQAFLLSVRSHTVPLVALVRSKAAQPCYLLGAVIANPQPLL